MERRAARGTRAHGPSTSILSSLTLRSRTGLATVSPFFFFAHRGLDARGAEELLARLLEVARSTQPSAR